MSCATYLSWINDVCVQLGVSGLQNRAPGGEQIPGDVFNICSDIENHQPNEWVVNISPVAKCNNESKEFVITAAIVVLGL